MGVAHLEYRAITAVVQAEFGISQPAVSQHLKVLRDSGFATVRPEGTRRLYAVDSVPFREIDATQREVGSGRTSAGEGRKVRLRRTYDAPVDDVWDALTNPERISRWFLPISGDFRLGGRYQFEGNAGGEIVACDRPHRIRVTWG